MADRLATRLRPRRVANAAQRRFRKYVYRDGDSITQWHRVVMNRRIESHLRGLQPELLSAVEISGSTHEHLPWREYRTSRIRDLDLCNPPAELDRYDVVVCEQVLEHVEDPWLAVETLRNLCVPGGHVVVSTPFMIRVHPSPLDCWRFTEDGLRRLLERSGLVVDATGSWGSRQAVRGNLRRFPPRAPWRSLRNDPQYALVVWAFARRPAEA